jgi:Protein of unknown function (DUF2726)
MNANLPIELLNDNIQSASLITQSQLPHSKELTTGKLLDFLQAVYGNRQLSFRKTLNQRLFSRTRPNFQVAIKSTLHLAYLDQRDGHGTQHWWRISYNDDWVELMADSVKSTAISRSNLKYKDPIGDGCNAAFEWGGMFFRSRVEVTVAEALDRRKVTFFGNPRGRFANYDISVSDRSNVNNGRFETDFLVFHAGKCMALEVDGKHHLTEFQTERDYVKDRLLLKAGIITVRFTAKECIDRPDEVISEFLQLFCVDRAGLN